MTHQQRYPQEQRPINTHIDPRVSPSLTSRPTPSPRGSPGLRVSPASRLTPSPRGSPGLRVSPASRLTPSPRGSPSPGFPPNSRYSYTGHLSPQSTYDPLAAVFLAVQQRDVNYLRTVLDRDPLDLNAARDREGRTPLILASAEGAFEIVRFLCGVQGINLDLQDYEGNSAIHHASLVGWAEIVDLLIQAGAYVEIENDQHLTPLIVAAYSGQAEACARLLDVGRADLNHRDGSGKTATILAAYEGHTDCVNVLLKRGANIDAQDQYGWTALMLSAHAGQMEMCRLLLVNSANRNIRSGSNKDAMLLSRDAGHAAIADMIATGGRMPSTPRPPGASYAEYGVKPPPPKPPVTPRLFGDVPIDRDSLGLVIPKHDPRRGRDRLVPRSQRQRGNPLSMGGATSSMQWISPTHGRTPLNPGQAQQRLGERRGPGDNVADLPPPSKENTAWELFAVAVTCCFPNICLKGMGKKDAQSKQAWREKCALCFVIFLISCVLGFLTFGLSSLACQKIVPIYPQEVAARYGVNSTGARVMIVRGQLYDLASFFKYGFHRPILPYTDADLKPTIDQLYGQDISALFPANPNVSGCPFTPLNGQLSLACNFEGDPRWHCHTSKNSNSILKSLNFNGLWVAYTWDNITRGDGGRKLLAYNEKVFDVSSYLNLSQDQWYLGIDINHRAQVYEWISSSVGKDITHDVTRNPAHKVFIPCFEDQFLVGKVDGTTIGCYATNFIIIIETVILMGITIIKFVSAVAFDWLFSRKLGKLSREIKSGDKISYVMLLVTCYSEGEDSMRTTLNSLAACKYSDRHKLLLVIADGNITGSGERRSTPDVCKSLMERQSPDEPEPQSYVAIGSGPKAHNMAQVYTGWYVFLGHRVPMILINKCGTPTEQGKPKAGNRGKRDSQLIMMQWLSKITFNERMTPLEFDLFEKVRGLVGVTADKYEMVLMVDADTLVKPDSLARMVVAMERDPEVMGLCGETKIANKSQSFTTMIQVFEYYISHHLGKAFESIFGGVTCLPGCFCMYRVKAPKYGGYIVPILASPEIVEMYSSNVVDTLHQKNLLLLGEDRYLTTLMIRTFPKRKMMYVPKAVCKTVVPDSFSVLLSQRRRWINSTIHNLMELILVPQLCGIFCCSMQFVVFLDLVGTIVLPAALMLLILLIVVGTVFHQDVLLPLLFMSALFVMQAILILLTTHKPVYVLWMLVYIFAIPIWNFVLPVYAFWHFDDFSWGATRQIQGVDTGHGEGAMEVFDPSTIPMKKWQDWHHEKRRAQLIQRQRGGTIRRVPLMNDKVFGGHK